MPLHKDIQAGELALVVDLLEGVELGVVRLPVRIDVRLLHCAQLAFEGPLAVDEAHIAKVEMFLVAQGAGEFGQLLFQLEDAAAAIDHEKFVVDLALPVLAVGEPVEPVMHLAVPAAVRAPVHFLYVAQQVEPEVDAQGDSGAGTFAGVVLQ